MLRFRALNGNVRTPAEADAAGNGVMFSHPVNACQSHGLDCDALLNAGWKARATDEQELADTLGTRAFISLRYEMGFYATLRLGQPLFRAGRA